MLAFTSDIYQTSCVLGSTQIRGHAYAYCDIINICMRKMGLGLVMWVGEFYVTSLSNTSKGKHYLLCHISTSFVLLGRQNEEY